MKNKKTKRIVIGVVVLIIIIYFAPINLYQSYRCVLKTNGETYWCRGMISSLYKKHKDKVDETKLLASSVKLDTIYELPTYIGNFKLSDSVGSLPSQCFSLYDFSNPKSVCIVLSEAKYFNGAKIGRAHV